MKPCDICGEYACDGCIDVSAVFPARERQAEYVNAIADARAAVRRSDEAQLKVTTRTHHEIEVVELRASVRALIQAVEALAKGAA